MIDDQLVKLCCDAAEKAALQDEEACPVGWNAPNRHAIEFIVKSALAALPEPVEVSKEHLDKLGWIFDQVFALPEHITIGEIKSALWRAVDSPSKAPSDKGE